MANNNGHQPVKPALTYEQQLDKFKTRGLIVTDDSAAIEILKRTNYYRLSGYTLSLKHNDKFFEGVHFHHVYNLYEFDRKLRNLLMSMLENIEIALRTDIAYLLGHKYKPLGYKNKENFFSEEHHKNFLIEVQKEITRGKKDLIISHHKQNYNGNLPIWTVTEFISFGTLSRLFQNLKKADQKSIARNIYNIHENYFESWLRHLANVRNLCAHYRRLYNKRLTVLPKLRDTDQSLGFKADKLFCSIYLMRHLCRDTHEWDHFVTNLHALLEQYENVEHELIGFPRNWEELLYMT